MRKETLNLIYQEPVKIGHWLGFRDLTDLHNDWLKDYLFGTGDQTKQAHRGSFKTTTFSLGGALDIITAPRKNTIMLRKTDSDVTEIIGQIGAIVNSNLFKKLVYDIYDIELKILKQNSTEIDTNLANTPKGRSQLLGLGIKTSITGKHADKVVTDDIINLKDRISTAEREYTKSVYMELENVRNRGGRILNYGTPWHKDDCFTLMPNIERFDCRSTGLMTEEQIAYLKSKMTPSLFAANYELKHIADDKAIFKEARFTKERDLILDGIGHIDAAYGGTDSTVFTIMRNVNGRLITLGKLWEKHVDDCLTEILQLATLYRCGTIHMEKNADKGYLKKEVVKRGQLAKGYSESTNKYVKIATYGKQYWSDVEFLEATDDEYIAQILDYNENAEHDDAPDSLSSLIRELKAKQVTVNLLHGGI